MPQDEYPTPPGSPPLPRLVLILPPPLSEIPHTSIDSTPTPTPTPSAIPAIVVTDYGAERYNSSLWSSKQVVRDESPAKEDTNRLVVPEFYCSSRRSRRSRRSTSKYYSYRRLHKTRTRPDTMVSDLDGWGGWDARKNDSGKESNEQHAGNGSPAKGGGAWLSLEQLSQLEKGMELKARSTWGIGTNGEGWVYGDTQPANIGEVGTKNEGSEDSEDMGFGPSIDGSGEKCLRRGMQDVDIEMDMDEDATEEEGTDPEAAGHIDKIREKRIRRYMQYADTGEDATKEEGNPMVW